MLLALAGDDPINDAIDQSGVINDAVEMEGTIKLPGNEQPKHGIIINKVPDSRSPKLIKDEDTTAPKLIPKEPSSQ